MPAIRIRPLSTTEAEHVLARVWCLLEQLQIASPKVTVRTHLDGQLEIMLTFRSQDLADLVQNKLLIWFPGSVPLPVEASSPGGDNG